jgi:hypothetical protein
MSDDFTLMDGRDEWPGPVTPGKQDRATPRAVGRASGPAVRVAASEALFCLRALVSVVGG